jgi:hypothetical protein
MAGTVLHDDFFAEQQEALQGTACKDKKVSAAHTHAHITKQRSAGVLGLLRIHLSS